MKKILCATLSAAVVTIGLAACDAAPPPEAAVSPPVESEVIPPGETVLDVVRERLAEIVRDPDVYSRARRLGALLPTLGPDVVSAVVQTLEDLTVDLRGTDLELLLRCWATHQPEEAWQWAAEKSPLSYREAAIYAALSTWAEADPPAAQQAGWPWTLKDRTYERMVPIAVVRGWHARGDSAGLRQWMSDLPPGIHRQRAIAAYLRILTEKQGIEAPLRWAESLPEDAEGESYKSDVFRRTIDAVSWIDIETGARWCDVHCFGPYGKNLRHIISRNWVLKDGPAALAWLESSRPGTGRNHAVRLTFALWTRTDPEAALAWMAEQVSAGEAEPWLRPVYPVYARVLTEEDPAEAMRWAERIEKAGESEMVMIEVARVWRHRDEAAAEEWLLQSPLSEEAREKARIPAKRIPGIPPPSS